MASLAIVLFVIVAMLVYMIRNQARKDVQVFPVPQEEQQKLEHEPVDQTIIDSLSAPVQSEEVDKKAIEDEKGILDSLSVPEGNVASEEKGEEEVFKSLEAPVK